MVLKQSITISDNGFLFDSTTGDSYSVNSTALQIVKLMKEGKEELEIRSEIERVFEVDPITLERNYFEFVNVLRHLHLLVAE